MQTSAIIVVHIGDSGARHNILVTIVSRGPCSRVKILIGVIIGSRRHFLTVDIFFIVIVDEWLI